ncbi:hypothetical protein A3758_34495 [Oleiphilus sp. HI0118]|nr:hypothetical protein A3758_34495 [Oleiphilus sp. HI0118]
MRPCPFIVVYIIVFVSFDSMRDTATIAKTDVTDVTAPKPEAQSSLAGPPSSGLFKQTEPSACAYFSCSVEYTHSTLNFRFGFLE